MTAIKRHPVVAYFALTFLLSWGGLLLVIRGGGMSGTAPTDDPRFAFALLAMLVGPPVSGVLLTAIVEGRQGLRDYGRRLVAWRAAWRWYAAALLIAPALWSASAFILSRVSPAFLPGVVTSERKLTHVLVGLAVAASAGVFEELGWTGFAIPRLRRAHGVFTTGLVVGMVWGAWHFLPTVLWAIPVTIGDVPRPAFMAVSVLTSLAGYLTAFRVLMAWVYEHTRSTLVGMLMHVSVTGSVLILEPAGMSGVTLLTFGITTAAIVWIAAAAIVWRPEWRPYRRLTRNPSRYPASKPSR